MGGLGIINLVAKPLDYVAWGLFALVIVGYHAFLLVRMHRRSDWASKVNVSLMLLVNPAYIGKFVRKAGTELTPVQTLRNSTIAATFVGGYAFTTASTYIADVVNSSSENPDAENTLSNRDVRRLVIASLLYLSFINFAVAVRFATHLGYLVGVATGLLDSQVPPPLIRRTYSEVEPAETGAAAGGDANGLRARPSGSGAAESDPPGDTAPGTSGGSDDPRGLGKRRFRYFLSIITCGMCGTSRGGRGASATSEPGHRDVEAGPPHVEEPLSRLEAIDVAIRAQEMIKRLSLHFSLGFRAFYAAIPVALYGAGAIPFMVATVFLLFWLHYIDFGLAT